MTLNSITDKSHVILVDEIDNQIGVMEKIEAHQKALLHRAVSVFIFNSGGEWILQRRALGKYHSNGLWTNTCCSHPYPGESSLEAAKRRLMEEMGMKCDLKEIFTFTYKASLDNELTEYELDHVFIGISDDLPQINEEEVWEWKAVSKSNLYMDLNINSHMYTVWFRKLYESVGNYFSGNTENN